MSLFNAVHYLACIHEKQTYSHRSRIMCGQFQSYFGIDEIYEEIYSRHFKKHYKGKPTKRYARLLKLINKAESIDETALLRLLK